MTHAVTVLVCSRLGAFDAVKEESEANLYFLPFSDRQSKSRTRTSIPINREPINNWTLRELSPSCYEHSDSQHDHLTAFVKPTKVMLGLARLDHLVRTLAFEW